MPKRKDIKKILVIGSGPIVIGQAAEFDYAGTQACLSLKEEGYEVILINSNPATIMTDKEVADKIYMEPLTVKFISMILKKERPDALLATLGGQTGLNIAVELSKIGILDELNIELLGTNLDSIDKAEDRERFKKLMREIGEPVPESKIVYNLEDAIDFVNNINFPIIVRPGFTLGGTGGGICHNLKELKEIVSAGLKLSPMNQCLIEKSIAGYKEIEYEVMRDKKDNAIVVCNMENFDPVGIHTGDSIVFAPSQTLSDVENQMLRDSSLKIIRALKIEGGCNVQLALDPNSFNYYVIEVNPRVSRSSALASKATGYPIARISAKIAIGLTLDEIINPITKATFAQFEPSLDYVVTKIPRWPFDKFKNANRLLGTQMKATGEVMSIGRNIEESLLKAVRSLDINICHLDCKNINDISDEILTEKMVKAQDDRILYLSEAIRRGYSIKEISDLTKIDLFFLDKLLHIVEIERQLKENYLDIKCLKIAKINGFSDKYISNLWDLKEEEIYKLRKQNKIIPVYKMVDTCAAEFESKTPYFYSTYEEENESIKNNKKSVLVIGSGPIKIGQGIEFDYATVHCVKAIQKEGYDAIIINSNPETVSTDFFISNKLYFEPLTVEDILHVIDIEKPIGVIVQFGGQVAINLAQPLYEKGIKILGTSIESLDTAENRDLFEKALKKLNILQPPGFTIKTKEDAIKIANKIGYPVLIRPSYVLGGMSMEIVKDNSTLENYIDNIMKFSKDYPILIDKYLKGKECEVDIISDGEDILIPGIIEHIESSGVHSGDSIAVYPPQNLSDLVKNKIIDYSKKIAIYLNCKGIMNIQFIIYKDEVYIIEVNPRVSRTVPFLSKILNIPMTQIATKIILGKKLKDIDYKSYLNKKDDKVYIKAPVFSYSKLEGVDPYLSPEMKSTGEIIAFDTSFQKALYKAFEASGIKLVKYGVVAISASNCYENDIKNIVRRFLNINYTVIILGEIYKYLSNNFKIINKKYEEVFSMLRKSEIDIIINIDENYIKKEEKNIKLRKNAIETSTSLITCIETAYALLDVLEYYSFSIDIIN